MSASYSTLIGALELAQRLRDPDWVVFDCRFDLADSTFGCQAYAASHVPGAFFLDLDEDLLNPEGLVALEIGHDQASQVRVLLESSGFADIAVRTDLSGIARFPFAKHT